MNKLFLKIQLLITILALSSLGFGTNLAFAQSAPFTIHPSYTHQGNKNWIILNTAPGSQIEDSVTLTNHSTSPISLNLSFKEAADQTDPKSSFKIFDTDNFVNLGKWVNLNQNQVTLNAGETKTVKIVLSIPENTPNDKYTGVILASYTSMQNNLNVVTRLGTRVYLSIDNNLPIQTLGQTNVFKLSAENPQVLIIILSLIGVIGSGMFLFKTKPHEQ